MTITQLMPRSVIPNKIVAQFCGAACSITGLLVLVLGFLKLEQMELSEAQLYSANIETLLLTAAFVGLALFFSRWRQVA